MPINPNELSKEQLEDVKDNSTNEGDVLLATAELEHIEAMRTWWESVWAGVLSAPRRRPAGFDTPPTPPAL